MYFLSIALHIGTQVTSAPSATAAKALEQSWRLSSSSGYEVQFGLVGSAVGSSVGDLLGPSEGAKDGVVDGAFVGRSVGTRVGRLDGTSVGTREVLGDDDDGTYVGVLVGETLGERVGVGDGVALQTLRSLSITGTCSSMYWHDMLYFLAVSWQVAEQLPLCPL